MSRRDIAFAAHDGTVLRGWLYLPEAATGAVPGIVMAHGFSATKEMGLDGHAGLLVAAGFAMLLYDHRALGESDGSPRQLIDPFVQTRDMMTAVGWLGSRPEVDADRLGVWGTSYSGGEALILAAIDPRVRAVATIVPYVGWPADVPDDDGAAFSALAERIRTAEIDPDQVAGPRAVVPAPDALPVVLMPDPDTAAWMLAASPASAGRWRNAVLSPARPGDVTFDPALAMPHLAAPVLMIAGSEDRVTPAADARTAAGLAGGRVELVIRPGHHCTFYAGEPRDAAGATIAAFFLRTL